MSTPMAAAERGWRFPRRLRYALVSLVLASALSGLEPLARSAVGAPEVAEARAKKSVRGTARRPVKRARSARVKSGRFTPSAALRRARERRIPAVRQVKAAPVLDTGAKTPRLKLSQMREAVLAAPPETVRRLGRHLMVGYHTPGQLTDLIKRGAIGGIFVTARNVRRRNKLVLAKEIEGFRALALEAGAEHFWVATDQEGGRISRLSPPLPLQPTLPRLLAQLKPGDDRAKAVADYAERQGSALASVGVNINFAPVADLPADIRTYDGATGLRYRAIAKDPATVSDVAAAYCATLHATGVTCTLKHFPGMGRVVGDSHTRPVKLETSLEELKSKDWVPFRQVMAKAPTFLMVGHPQLAAIDAVNPASTSRAVIGGILRDDWKYDGVVITDDLAMGAIRRRAGGLGPAAADALKAGADMVLIGVDGDEVYAALYAMIEAERDGTLSGEMLSRSRQRLRKAAALELAAKAQKAARETEAIRKKVTRFDEMQRLREIAAAEFLNDAAANGVAGIEDDGAANRDATTRKTAIPGPPGKPGKPGKSGGPGKSGEPGKSGTAGVAEAGVAEQAGGGSNNAGSPPAPARATGGAPVRDAAGVGVPASSGVPVRGESGVAPAPGTGALRPTAISAAPNTPRPAGQSRSTRPKALKLSRPAAQANRTAAPARRWKRQAPQVRKKPLASARQ